MAGNFLYTALLRFSTSQSRYTDLKKKMRADDFDGVPYRVQEWLKRFRNVFTFLFTHSLMRHEKAIEASSHTLRHPRTHNR